MLRNIALGCRGLSGCDGRRCRSGFPEWRWEGMSVGGVGGEQMGRGRWGALSQPPGELEWGGPCELEAGTGSREGATSIYQGSWKEL